MQNTAPDLTTSKFGDAPKVAVVGEKGTFGSQADKDLGEVVIAPVRFDPARAHDLEAFRGQLGVSR